MNKDKPVKNPMGDKQLAALAARLMAIHPSISDFQRQNAAGGDLVQAFLDSPVCGYDLADYCEQIFQVKTLTRAQVSELAAKIRDFVLREHPSEQFSPMGRFEAYLEAGRMLFGPEFCASSCAGVMRRVA